MDDDVGLGLRSTACHSNVGDDRQLSELDDILVSLNLVTEEVDKEENQRRQSQANDECYEEYLTLLRAYLSYEEWQVDELSLIGCGGK